MTTYAAWSLDTENLYYSSSGGIFFELAKKMVEQKGRVAGVVMNGTQAQYMVTNDIETIKQMRGSKYIHANPWLARLEGRMLFVGLPCTIQAMKRMHNTRTIILCDLRCHGLPKAGIFEEHIKKISRGKEVKSIRFRDKQVGWKNSQTLLVEFTNGETYDCYDEFMEGYMDGSILQERCKQCKLCRVGDITLGDFWTAPKKFYDEAGVSVVFTNTKRGHEFFDSIGKNVMKYKVHFYHYINMSFLKHLIHKTLTRSGMLDRIKKAYYRGACE